MAAVSSRYARALADVIADAKLDATQGRRATSLPGRSLRGKPRIARGVGVARHPR